MTNPEEQIIESLAGRSLEITVGRSSETISYGLKRLSCEEGDEKKGLKGMAGIHVNCHKYYRSHKIHPINYSKGYNKIINNSSNLVGKIRV